MESELIRDELFKNVEKFMNELELTMDYLDKSTVSSVKRYMTSIKNNNQLFEDFVEYTATHLQTFEAQISATLFSTRKIKSGYYNFLSGVTLFNGILNFRIFENESKNTKKDLIKYLYSIYMSCVFLSTKNASEGTLSSKLEDFVCKIQSEAAALKEEDVKPTKHRRNALVLDDKLQDVFKGLQGNEASLGDFGNVMQSILGNTDILNIATDISQKMQSSNMNPMSMLSSLMSGNIQNSPLQSLVEEIQQKVESKISSGEINKENLENQAKSLMGSLGSSNPGNMGDMTTLINNMVNDLNGKESLK